MDVTTAILPHLRASKAAKLVIIGSRAGWRTGIPVRPPQYYDISEVCIRLPSFTQGIGE